MDRMDRLEKELENLINCHSAENDSNTPDFILAQYLRACLENYNTATQQRETWYGRDPRPSFSTIDSESQEMSIEEAILDGLSL